MESQEKMSLWDELTDILSEMKRCKIPGSSRRAKKADKLILDLISILVRDLEHDYKGMVDYILEEYDKVNKVYKK